MNSVNKYEWVMDRPEVRARWENGPDWADPDRFTWDLSDPTWKWDNPPEVNERIRAARQELARILAEQQHAS